MAIFNSYVSHYQRVASWIWMDQVLQTSLPHEAPLKKNPSWCESGIESIILRGGLTMKNKDLANDSWIRVSPIFFYAHIPPIYGNLHLENMFINHWMELGILFLQTNRYMSFVC